MEALPPSVVERLLRPDDEDAAPALSRASTQRLRSVERYLEAGNPPRWMERLGQIDRGIANARRRLERAYRALADQERDSKTEKTQPRQLVYYDPGVGTLARPDPWHRLKQDFNAILGLATGYGLDDNVLAAYAFLVNNFEDGDQIYLFGFSRGAYAVRVLAGLVHKIGLISPQQVNLAGSGLTGATVRSRWTALRMLTATFSGP